MRQTHRAYIYARVSTDMQLESALDAQIRACHEYADRRDDLVVHGGAHREQISGAVAPELRPVLSALLEDLDRHQGVLLVAALDRLSRSNRDTLDLVDRANLHGWVIVPLDHPEMDMSTPAGKAMVSMLGVFAEFQRSNIAVAVRRGIRENKLRGSRFGRPVEHSDEARARMRELRAEGLSLRAVCRVLTEENYATPRGGTWWPATIREMEQSDRLDAEAEENRRRYEEALQQ